MQQRRRFVASRCAHHTEESPMSELHTLLTDLKFGESPRWHGERLWVADWGAREIIAVDRAGRRAVIAHAPSFPCCIDFLHDGRLLMVSSDDGLLVRREPDGTVVTHADLRSLTARGWNEIVVDGRGNIYVNGGSFDFSPDASRASGIIALVRPDGSVRQVADGLAFPNGMAVTPDNATLIVAESYASKLTAFDIAADGSLSGRRVWADLGKGAPDGICLDANGAVWYADVPNKRSVRVREGGTVLQTIDLDRGCFACMLGGGDGKTLYLVVREWRGFESASDPSLASHVLMTEAPAPHAGWP
jgi:sugar lactone lactonase YvrE